jgi:hypothetical protein
MVVCAFLHQKVGIPHTYRNKGKSIGRLRSTTIPAAYENFFAEVGILVENVETFSPPSIDTLDIIKIVRIVQGEYGLNVMMP